MVTIPSLPVPRRKKKTDRKKKQRKEGGRREEGRREIGERRERRNYKTSKTAA